MLSRKMTPMAAPANLSETVVPVSPAPAKRHQRVTDVEVTSLQIEQDPNTGGDPYNSTGQFCVVDIVKDQ